MALIGLTGRLSVELCWRNGARTARRPREPADLRGGEMARAVHPDNCVAERLRDVSEAQPELVRGALRPSIPLRRE